MSRVLLAVGSRGGWRAAHGKSTHGQTTLDTTGFGRTTAFRSQSCRAGLVPYQFPARGGGLGGGSRHLTQPIVPGALHIALAHRPGLDKVKTRPETNCGGIFKRL